MPATVTKTIAFTSSPTVPDYTSISAWMAACPSDLTVADEIYDGQCLDQGEFTSASQFVISGITTDATRYIILECAPGASFNSKSGVRTTPLFYNASNGVAFRNTGSYQDTFIPGVNYTRVLGIQVSDNLAQSDTAFRLTGSNVTVSGCIVTSGQGEGIRSQSDFSIISNNIVIIQGSSGGAGIKTERNTPESVYDNTVIDLHNNGVGIGESYYNKAILIGNAVFGFATAFSGSFDASSGFNATDAASAPGSNNQTSLTFASQFVNSTNDFRADSGGSLGNNGTPISGITVDISLFTRSASSPTIGCWELGSSGTTVFADMGCPTEWLSSVRQDSISPLEYISTLQRDSGIPLEHLVSVSRDAANPEEYLAGVQADQILPLEWTGGVSVTADANLSLEYISNLQKDSAEPLEWLSSGQRDTPLPVENLGSVQRDLEPPLEILATVRVDNPLLIEWTGAISVTTDSPTPLEWLSSVSRDSITPLEFIVSVLRDAGIPEEHLLSISANQITQEEFTSSINYSAVLLLEYLGAEVVTDVYYGINFVPNLR